MAVISPSPRVLPLLFRILALALPLLAIVVSNTALAAVKTGIDELDSPFSQFVEGKGSARTDALDTIVTLQRNDTRELLNGILEGDLMRHKSTDTIVWVSKNGSRFSMQSMDRSTDLGEESKRSFSRLKITNKIRRHIRALIAALGLRSDDPVQRLAAIDSLMETPELLPSETLTELLGSESDSKVLKALGAIQARKLAVSTESEDRLQALNTLQHDLSSSSRSLIQELASNDADPAVQKAAKIAATAQASRVKLFATVETLFFGLSLGSVLVLAAIGLAISFGVMGVINMAHGELIMLGAYCAWGMQQLMPDSLGVSLLLSIPVAFLLTGMVGILIERTVIRFLYGRPLETLLATFGISLILQQLVRTFISSQNVPVANPEFMSGVLEINSIFSLTLNRLYILGFCLITFLLLLSLLKRTRFGLEVRAVSQNRSMARAMGVRSSRIDSLTFGLGAGIAGVAGVALSQLTNVGPNLGQAYIVDSFMVVVFGGVGNLWGTLISGMTLGIANKLMEPWAGAILAKILVLIFLIMFIQIRPRGLFPQRGRAVESH